MSFVTRFLGALALAVLAPTVFAQGDSCGCSDARDLYLRHCAAKDAMQEWNRLIRYFRSSERGKSAVFGATEVKDDLAKCVDERISMTRQESPGARTAKGETDRSCNVTVNAPTQCLGGVIRQHESFHKMMCEAHNRPDAPWRNTENPFAYLAGMVNRMASQSAIDYMLEERTAYQIEVDYTRDRLEELASRCSVPSVFRQDRQGRGFTLQDCPRPDPSNYELSCKFK